MTYSTGQTINRLLRSCMMAFAMLFLVAPILTGCGDRADEVDRDGLTGIGTKPTGARARTGTLTRKGFTVDSVDLNQDEEADQWTYTVPGRTERIERDLNFDGEVDLWQYPGADGQIIEEEMDLDLDGRVDVVVYYDGGTVTRKELSTDFVGLFTIVKFYDKGGELLRVERDEDGDSDVDVWEYYEKKQRVRIGWDEDNDGQPDRFDTLE